MSRNRILAIVTAVSVSACLYACGSDDDTNPGGAGTGGHSAGKGGGGGKGGGSGSTTGGTGNEAGQTENNAGQGGAELAGSGGEGGDKGSMAGDTGLGGAGGEGGAPVVEQTLAEACTTACTPAHAVATCTNTVEACVAQCIAYPGTVASQVPEFIAPADGVTLNAEYLTAIRCIAKKVTTTEQFACPADGTMSGLTQSPKKPNDCETELCKWTCDDVTLPGTQSGDQNVITRCGC